MKQQRIIHLTIIFLVFCNFLFGQNPYALKWKKESLIFGAEIIIGISASGIDNQVKPLNQNEIQGLNKNQINVFDRSAANNYSESTAQLSNYLIGACLVSPIITVAGKKTRDAFAVISTMYLETALLAVFLPSYGKGSVQRIRPYVYNDKAPMEMKLTAEARRSFFSGHTTMAFSSAVFLATIYSNYYPTSKYKPFVWSGSLLMAGAVGFARYKAGAHFPTDVLVGAIVGSSIGFIVPYMHKVRKSNTLTIVPNVLINRIGLGFVWQLGDNTKIR